MANQSKFSRSLIILALITAGESVFLLPFVVARIFRPTFLDVFGLTNFELGSAFSVYGLVAMISYFAGGPLADLFSARKLMAVALVITGLGGIVFASIPSLGALVILYGFWGLTTILLFWAALIRATREWGGDSSQGTAYGLLDGGRGLVAALLATISVWIFSLLLPVEVASASLQERAAALGQIIWFFSGLTMIIAIFVWWVIPDSKSLYQSSNKSLMDFVGVKEVIKMPTIWLQAMIVLCAYVGYKCTDDFSLYARDAFGYDDVEAAKIGTISFWVRPFVAVGAGLLADRISSSKVMILGFLIMMLGSLAISFGWLQQGLYWLLVTTIAGTSVGIYALRGVYFALFQEAKVPLVFTGSAVGVVSVIGYTPDVFMGPLMGYLIDRSPGAAGHQDVFAMLAGFALVGLICTILFRQKSSLLSHAINNPN